MLERLAPKFTARRTIAKLVLDGVREPRHLPTRVNRHNLREFVRFQRTTSRCTVCGHVGRLVYELPDLERHRYHHIEPRRETLRCAGCTSKMRDRTIAAGLLAFAAERYGVTAADVVELAQRLPAEARVLDTDARSRISERMKGHPGWIRSLYYPDQPMGESLGEERLVNIDLEQMSFPDGRFDLIITSEVMEHVRHVDVAHREIARCLAPDGTYLFTAPYDPALAETLVLIDPVTDEPLVWPMHIHGDPGLRPTGIKSYRVFGRDIIEQLADAGLTGRFAPVDDASIGVFGGDLFLATPTATPAPG